LGLPWDYGRLWGNPICGYGDRVRPQDGEMS